MVYDDIARAFDTRTGPSGRILPVPFDRNVTPCLCCFIFLAIGNAAADAFLCNFIFNVRLPPLPPPPPPPPALVAGSLKLSLIWIILPEATAFFKPRLTRADETSPRAFCKQMEGVSRVSGKKELKAFSCGARRTHGDGAVRIRNAWS